MKIWNIVNEKIDFNIEITDITTLYGQHYVWHSLIRQIDNFFNSRHSEVKIFEDGQPINKKDWQCFFIPFDAEVHLTKITARSPLKGLQNDVSEQISYSPFFQELQEVWGQLKEELYLVNQRLKKWGLTSSLKAVSKKDISDFITFHPTNAHSFSPIAIKKLLLNIMLDRSFDKNTLIIIELPELYANDQDIVEFYSVVNKAKKKGYNFLFVSEYQNKGAINYFYKNTVINKAFLEQIRLKVMKVLPFHCSNKLYKEAVNVFIQLVDNSILEEDLLEIGHSNIGAIVTIIHVIMYNLNIGSLQDTQGLEPNLKRFITEYN